MANEGASRLIWAGLVLLLPVVLLHGYDRWASVLSPFGVELAKRTPDELPPVVPVPPVIGASPSAVKDAADSAGVAVALVHPGAPPLADTVREAMDTLARPKRYPMPRNLPPLEVPWPDTARTGHRVMLLGDSQSGGLNRYLRAYCAANGHELVATFTWNSASIYNFAYADTVLKALEAYRPTFVVFVIGLNELYARDLAKRRAAAEAFELRLAGIPHMWIGPANFTQDHGLNEVYQEVAGTDAYFMTRGMDLPRGGDGRHPSGQGYSIWMDSVATWMAERPQLALFRQRPTGRERMGRTGRISLNASRYKGY